MDEAYWYKGSPMPDFADIEKHAEGIKKDLAVPKQNEVFKAAAEAGYLVLCAGRNCRRRRARDARSRSKILSAGAVIEWEVEDLLESAEKMRRPMAKRNARDAVARIERARTTRSWCFVCGVRRAPSGGIDKKELAILHAIGKAAGVAKTKSPRLKRVGAATSE